jgi:acetoin utilization deacetylase AcuC-like enzyme
MRTLLITHDVFAEHDTGRHHPERPARLVAAVAGARAGAASLLELEAPQVRSELLAAVHDPAYIAAVERFCLAGGGALDPDTVAVPASWEAALRSAGAGHLAVERLRAGEADNAFLAVRPPGHHAERSRAMGFCLFNNIAVVAQELVDGGERVAIVDWDVHHGNGTEVMFEGSPDVFYVSFHQYPFYPGTGSSADEGVGAGAGYTLNLPFPPGTAGDVYRRAMAEVVVPALQRFAPDWILVSAGYDAHADDPLAELRLLPSDYARMAVGLAAVVGPGRTVYFLEGGYDLAAIESSVAATLRGAAGGSVPDESLRSMSPAAAHEVIERVGHAARRADE